MRDRVAPEARGSRRTAQAARPGRSGRIGLAGLLLLAFLQPFPLPDATHAGASATTLAAEEPRRQLQAPQDGLKPGFSLPDVNGSRHELKPPADGLVLVHFFATWCEPCKQELASLTRLLARPDGPKLAIVAVSVAEPPMRVARFLETTPLDFPVLLDADRAVSKAWGVGILPTTFVLDHNLLARLAVEGDIDWLHPDVVAALEQIGAGRAK
jgi:peroxiredoxin